MVNVEAYKLPRKNPAVLKKAARVRFEISPRALLGAAKDSFTGVAVFDPALGRVDGREVMRREKNSFSTPET
jgi:hypothetical protein